MPSFNLRFLKKVCNGNRESSRKQEFPTQDIVESVKFSLATPSGCILSCIAIPNH